jgi:hypothetical protein
LDIQGRDQLIQVKLWFEGRCLLLQALDQLAACAVWQARDVVYGFVGVQRHALTTHMGQRVHHMGMKRLQAQLKHLEQAHWASPDDQGVG